MAGIVALGVSFGRQPTYEATALLSIDQTQETGQGFDLAMQADQFLSQRFISIAKDGPAAAQVEDDLTGGGFRQLGAVMNAVPDRLQLLRGPVELIAHLLELVLEVLAL